MWPSHDRWLNLQFYNTFDSFISLSTTKMKEYWLELERVLETTNKRSRVYNLNFEVVWEQTPGCKYPSLRSRYIFLC